MAGLLSLAEHLLNVKDLEVVDCDMQELKRKNIIILDVVPKTVKTAQFVAEFAQDMTIPPGNPDYGEPMIGMVLKSCSDIALNALRALNTM